jgi:hypothetical protein
MNVVFFFSATDRRWCGGVVVVVFGCAFFSRNFFQVGLGTLQPSV